MQNRYTGDVGDFGKYGLLRALCLPEGDRGPALRLGVVWYLTSDESHNNDGRHVGYLEPTPKNAKAFRVCDPGLYDTLAEIVRGGARNVSAIRQRRVLPDDTVFYERLLDLDRQTVDAKRVSRIQARQQWVHGAVQATQDCDVVFVDPDNGIGTTAQASSRSGAKYVLLEELIPYLDRGQTLVIYHHLNRSAAAETQVSQRLAELEERLTPQVGVMALRYRRGSARVFFVLTMVPQVAGLLEMRLGQMNDGPWGAHFVRAP